ncbi:hypothetical protein [uncultured Helicobacter sp.]|uniref:hypothetical protein n=1 Tax=uncultured Helicobacter sp. TaxID=175537 RepID=UPI001C39C723|nr:hypothetical protein [Candidatus Helicobacter avicola]
MKKTSHLLLLMCVGIGIGVGISELSKHLHTQEFIPNQYNPTAQNSQDTQDTDSQNPAQDLKSTLTQDSQNLEENLAPNTQPSQDSQNQTQDLPNPPLAQTETLETNVTPQDPALSTAIAQDIFSQERQIPQFQEYTTSIYQGQFMSADESCVNCEGGPQEALKRGIIEFGGKYALYQLKPNSGEIIIGAVNVENGEVMEFPTIYKEVAPPFDVSILAKPDSDLIWLKGVDSKNPDTYKIEAYTLKSGNLKKVQSFEIHFVIPESLDLQSTPAQEQNQDNTQEEVRF